MNLRRSLHTNKGYTLIELMITLLIFAIITMFGVPAFYDFIEQSRAKSQMIKAANFLRSAQEIATSTNRIVYVYTAGYFDYEELDISNDERKGIDDKIKLYQAYWYQDWIMSFKPIGFKHVSIDQQDKALEIQREKDDDEKEKSHQSEKDSGKYSTVGTGSPNTNYLIARQSIFTKSNQYNLSVLDSLDHNAIDRKKLAKSTVNIEMEGYSRVRQAPDQGVVEGKPTYLVFYPSGALIMPVFVLDANAVDESFSSTKSWNNIKGKFKDPIGVLAGCRIGGGLTMDVINYTFNKALIQNVITFAPTAVLGTSGSPPSFSEHICGSKFLQ